MTQEELDQLPELGGFDLVPHPTIPNAVVPVQRDMAVLEDAVLVIDAHDVCWMVGIYAGRLWKVRVR